MSNLVAEPSVFGCCTEKQKMVTMQYKKDTFVLNCYHHGSDGRETQQKQQFVPTDYRVGRVTTWKDKSKNVSVGVVRLLVNERVGIEADRNATHGWSSIVTRRISQCRRIGTDVSSDRISNASTISPKMITVLTRYRPIVLELI